MKDTKVYRKFLRPLLAAALGLCVLGLTACGGPDEPEEVAVTFITSFANGDVTTAMDLIYFPERIKKDANAMNMANGKIMQMVARGKSKIDDKGGIKSITAKAVREVPQSQDNMEKLKVDVETITNNGSVSVDTVNLIKVNDYWKVEL